MAIWGSAQKNKVKQTGLWGTRKTSTGMTPEIQRAFDEYKLEFPKKKGVLGTLGKVLDVLRTGEYAVGGLMAGKGIIKGIKEKISPSEVIFKDTEEKRKLFSKRGIAGLAADILLDPTTYLTFGIGGAAKIATKSGAKIALSKAGKGVFKEVIEKGATRQAAQRTMARLIEEGGEAAATKYIAKDGLKFLGQQILPRKIVAAPFKPAKWVIENVPLLNKGRKALAKAFKPFSEINEMPAKLGGESIYQGATINFQKTLRYKQAKSFTEILAKTKPYYKQYGKDIGSTIAYKIEKGKLTGDKMLDDLIKFISKGQREMLTTERALMGYKMVRKARGLGDVSKLGKKSLETLAEFDVKTLEDLWKADPQDLLNVLGIQKSEKGLLEVQKIKTEAKLLQNKFIGAAPKRLTQVEKVAGAKRIGEIQGYVRHYLTPEAREWMDKGGSVFQTLPTPLRAKLASADRRTIQGTLREINSSFKTTTGKAFNFFEPDAIKAFAMRQAEHIRFVNAKAHLERIKGFGKKAEFTDAIKDTTGKVVQEGKLKPFFKEGVEFIETKAPELKGHLFPKPIAKHIDEVRAILTKEESLNAFVKMYDKALSIWKGSVTGYFPAFHTRNFIGGSFNNWLAGVKNPARYIQAEDIIRGKNKTYITKLGEKIDGSEIFRQGELKGVFGQPGMIDTAEELSTKIAKLDRGKFNVKNAAGYPRILMETVENRLRMPLFLDRVLKGDSYEEAARWVFKFHFDYMPEGLTGFERVWMRRLIPFYVWTRNNIPLQIEQMLKQPGKYAGLEKIRKYVTGKDGEVEMENLPDWMKNTFVAKLPFTNKIGKSLWLQLDLPLEDVAKLPINADGIRELVSMLTPFLKYPIEIQTNRNLYFGSEIYNPALPREMQTAKTIEQLKALPAPIKKFLNFREVQYRDYNAEKKSKSDKKIFKTRYEMDAKKLHLLRSAVGRFYSTIGQIFDPEMASKMEWMKLTRFMGGIPVRPFDMEEEKANRESQQEKEFNEILNYLKKRKEIPYKT